MYWLNQKVEIKPEDSPVKDVELQWTKKKKYKGMNYTNLIAGLSKIDSYAKTTPSAKAQQSPYENTFKFTRTVFLFGYAPHHIHSYISVGLDPCIILWESKGNIDKLHILQSFNIRILPLIRIHNNMYWFFPDPTSFIVIIQ